MTRFGLERERFLSPRWQSTLPSSGDGELWISVFKSSMPILHNSLIFLFLKAMNQKHSVYQLPTFLFITLLPTGALRREGWFSTSRLYLGRHINMWNTKTRPVWNAVSFFVAYGPGGSGQLCELACTLGKTPWSAGGDFNQQAYLCFTKRCPNLPPGHVWRNSQFVEVISDTGNPVFTT